MARLGCACGATMSTVDCPSPNVYHLYTGKEVTDALKQSPTRRFWDFHTNWDSVEDKEFRFTDDRYSYWYCTACGRFYQVEAKPQGRWVKKYMISADTVSLPQDIGPWNRLYVYADAVVDQLTEKDFDISLHDFIHHKKHTHDFYISDDLSKVAVCQRGTTNIEKLYLLEDCV